MKGKVSLVALLFPVIVQAQEYKAFGGVWMGQTDYKDGETPSLNVGSFFLAEMPFIRNLHFGYAISANTNIALESATGFDDLGNFVSVNLAGIGVHVPLELNLAYVLGLGKFRLWGGGGVNLSVAQATLNLAYSDLTNGYTCNASATGRPSLPKASRSSEEENTSSEVSRWWADSGELLPNSSTCTLRRWT